MMAKQLQYILLIILSFISSTIFAAPEFHGPIKFKYAYVTQDMQANDYWPIFINDNTVVFSRLNLQPNAIWKLMSLSLSKGSEPVPLVPPNFTYNTNRADYSPTTNEIIFATYNAGTYSGLWTVHPDGSQLSQAFDKPGLNLTYPSFLPNGESVIAKSWIGDDMSPWLVAINLQSKTSQTITDNNLIYTGMANVSHDGNNVVIAAQLNQGQPYNENLNQLWMMNLPTRTFTQIDPLQARAVYFSPDDKLLAFESDRGSSTGLYAAFIEPVNGGPAICVTPRSLNAQHPVWSPDGSKLVFTGSLPGSTNGARGIGIVDLHNIHFIEALYKSGQAARIGSACIGDNE